LSSEEGPLRGREIWEQEYRLRGLPTSRKSEPSRGARFLVEVLSAAGAPCQGRLLDAGCGSGRNALFLAVQGFEVCGLDIALEALREFRAAVSAAGLGARALCLQQSMDTLYPFRPSSFDVATSFTSLENLVDDEELDRFREEVWRVLRPSGYLSLYFLTTGDGFYGPLPRQSTERHVVVAPDSGLTQRVYEEGEVEDLFGRRFRVVRRRSFRFDDSRFGRSYERHLTGLVLQK
jgi:SAM-dependent methyltransferase